MDARGAVEHDGGLFCEVREGTWGDAQTNPTRLDHDLSLWQVNPIVEASPDHRPGAPLQEITASAARSERESVQVALLPRSDLGAVTASVVPPSHGSGYLLRAGLAAEIQRLPP